MDKIDFIIPWVDGNDAEWLLEKNSYNLKNIKELNFDSEARFRDWGYLKYWFRGIEKFTPWVNKIHFITWGHIPEWLDTTNEKINIVYHKDYIPDEYLPTFSSHVIELNFHRIEGLAEQFVYFNDDMYIIREMSENDFFKNSLPCDEGLFSFIFHTDNYTDPPHYILNMVGVINQHFNFQEQLEKHKEKFLNPIYSDQLSINEFYSKFKLFPSFYIHHLPQAFRKSVFKHVWDKEGELLHKVSLNKFRDVRDVSQYLMRFWQLIDGQFEPTFFRKNGWTFSKPEVEYTRIAEYIKSQERPLLCINDSGDINNFDEIKIQIDEAFASIFPEKSSFEI